MNTYTHLGLEDAENELRRFVVPAVVIHRPSSVDDVLRRKIESGCDRGASGLASADGITGVCQFVVSRISEDCSADAASGS